MKISAIIPTLNRERYVKRAIESVMCQSAPVDEIIVVDNGSCDDTCSLIRENYPKIKLLHEPKLGVSRARNRGILNAKNSWVAFLDSDDEWSKFKNEKFVAAYSASCEKYNIWHCNEIWFRNGLKLNQKKRHKKKGGDLFKSCLDMCCVSPSSSVMNKKIFKNFGLFDEEMEVCEDYDFWLRVSIDESFGFIDEELVIKHGGHNDQLSKKFWGMDRFRLKSLLKLANNNKFQPIRRHLLIKQIVLKLEIIVNGARKRGNWDILSRYLPLLIHWKKIEKEILLEGNIA